MRRTLILAAAALLATGAAAAAGPLDGAFAPLAGRSNNPCPLGYSPDESGRCFTNSFGFGAGAFPLGYRVGPYGAYAPIDGRPYSVYATEGASQYVIGR